MSILSRYVFREYVVPLAYCLGGFLSIYVLFELFGSFSRLMSANLPWTMTVDYFCAYLAPYFEWLAPAALMLAALYTMWNFCRHSELVAMRANGISFLTIARPILLAALALAAFVWWVNDCYVPRRAQWARAMKTCQFKLDEVGVAENIVYRNSQDFRTWTVDRMADADAKHLEGVRITADRPDGGARILNITAKRADYLDGEWWLTEPTVQHYDAGGMEIASVTPAADRLSLRCFPEFGEKPADFLMQNRDWAYNSISDRIRYLRTRTDIPEQLRNRYRYDTLAKILAPLACLVITLFAIPAGIASGRQSVFRGIMCALGMFFSFYGVTIGCLIGADCGWLNPILAAVLPHAVFLALGIRAFRRQR